jgi:hypothetical protein
MRQRLMLRIQPRKRGQQRRMNIQNPAREFAHETGAQQPHVARQAHQFDAAPL